nr:MLX-interacting protein-like [Leptinotarsa decemlineata]
MFTIQHVTRPERQEKECIHSGHFMVSHFEAEEQDDEDNVAVPIPESTDPKTIVPLVTARPRSIQNCTENQKNQLQLAIDTSLAKLFQCMSLAYRQKLTSPKWNRFRGIRLRWKDKIRLNNVIWRCWHLQFIKKENTLVCQFASPLDVDIHNKPEAVVLEGKYWKRKLAAVTAEYKKWRMFYRNNLLGHATKEPPDILNDMDLLVWDSNSSENLNMMVDEDYMGLMSDTLFTTITNQPYVFPDTREIAKAGYADFIQPSLGPLQPTLDEFMDTSPFFPEFLSSKLATVPEESQGAQQPSGWGYMSSDLNNTDNSLEVASLESSSQIEQYQLSQIQPVPIQDTRQTEDLISPNFSDMMLEQQVDSYISSSQQSPFSTVISKNNTKTTKNIPLPRNKMQNVVYSKSSDNVYPSYSQQNISSQDVDRICNTSHANQSQASQQQQVQELQHQVQDIQHYKLVTVQQPDQKQSYKFSMVTTPTVKFTTSQVHQQMMQSYPSFSQYSSVPSAVSLWFSINISFDGIVPLLIFVVTLTQTHAFVSFSFAILLFIYFLLILLKILVLWDTRDFFMGFKVTYLTEDNKLHLDNNCQMNLIHLTSYSNSSSPITDPLSQNIHSPTSSQSSVGSPCAESSSQRDRRVVHIHAEQKRRFNIKNGFDTLHSLIPQLNQNPNAKSSKAALLQKGADYIIQLRAERNQLKEEMDSLRQQIETLNTSISNCQSLLPATGAPVSRNRDSKMQEMFDEYVRNRTMDNWKFWIFSLMFKPLLNSFSSFVSSSSLDDLYSSTMLWVEQHCTLGDLRPVVLNSLRYLCTKTEILSEPEKLPEEARQIVIQSNQSQKN